MQDLQEAPEAKTMLDLITFAPVTVKSQYFWLNYNDSLR
jgi:hypothetical protein